MFSNIIPYAGVDHVVGLGLIQDYPHKHPEQRPEDKVKAPQGIGKHGRPFTKAYQGDYDTVSSLSICELIRPQDAPYVSVARYIWNGRQRQLISSEEELKAALA